VADRAHCMDDRAGSGSGVMDIMADSQQKTWSAYIDRFTAAATASDDMTSSADTAPQALTSAGQQPVLLHRYTLSDGLYGW